MSPGSRQEYIVISYYGIDNEIHIFPYDQATMEDINELYDAINEDYGYDFKESNCDYIIIEKLNIQIH